MAVGAGPIVLGMLKSCFCKLGVLSAGVLTKEPYYFGSRLGPLIVENLIFFHTEVIEYVCVSVCTCTFASMQVLYASLV